MFWNRSVVVYFSTATKRRSCAASWSIIAPPLIVARDAYVSWQGSRYSVPWPYAGREVWVRQRGRAVEVHFGQERIAIHPQALGRHLVVTQPEHHRGIPLG